MKFEFDVFATLVATIFSSLVTIILYFVTKRKDTLSSLDSQLDSILKLSIKYPYLESVTFTATWKENCKSDKEKYRRYENYATLVFNYLSRVCNYFHYNMKKIHNYVDINGWVSIHKLYWHNPTLLDENERVYDDKFKKIIHEILGEVNR